MNIDIGNGYALSVQPDSVDGNKKGVSIILAKDGEMVQELVLVEKVDGEDAVRAYVWSNEMDEDFTHRLTIPYFKEENVLKGEGNDGGHRESRQTW